MRRFPHLLSGALLAFGLFSVVTLPAQDLTFPSDVFNGDCIDVSVVPGVDKSGMTDSSAGLQTAMNMLADFDVTLQPRPKTLYFPNGTYKINRTLDCSSRIATTGSTTSGSAIITGLGTTTDVVAGDTIVSANFPAGTTVSSVNAGPSQVTASKQATVTGLGVTVTFTRLLERIALIGQSRDGTKLVLESTGFVTGSGPAMVKTEEYYTSNTNAFDNYVCNLTIDAGAANVNGLVGLDFLGNNTASVRHVLIKTTGAGTGTVGLAMTRTYPGPCMIENVEVSGFATGVAVGQEEDSVTFEHLTLENQTVVGLNNSSDAVFIRGFVSTNSHPVHAINNSSNALLVLVGDVGAPASATYTGGGTAGVNAIDNTVSGTTAGGALVRGFTSTNYTKAVGNPNGGGSNITGDAPAGYVAEYTTHPVLTPGLANAATHSLNLPVQETPQVTDNNFANWINVSKAPYNVQPNPAANVFDQSAGIQAALDAAASASSPSTVYFPPGHYIVTHTLKVHGNCQRILGFGSYFAIGSDMNDTTSAFGVAYKNNPQPVFQVGGIPDLSVDLKVERLGFYVTSQPGHTAYFTVVQQSTARTLTLQDMSVPGGGLDTSGLPTEVAYKSAATGTLFLDDVDGSNWQFTTPGQKIFARQLDPEGDTNGAGSLYPAKVTNTGSTLWILGLKTEDFGTLIESTAGASTEVLGAFCYAVHASGPILPDNLFDVQNSDFSASYITNLSPDYPNEVSETEGGQTAVLHNYGSPSSPTAYQRYHSPTVNSSLVPLVVASPNGPALAVPGVDIGTVGAMGTASASNGVYTISGAGAGLGGTADAFHLCSLAVAGDTPLTVTARVTALPTGSTHPLQSGVMVRDTTTAGSDMVSCTVNDYTTAYRTSFIIRSTAGGGIVQAIGPSVTLPCYVRLVRSGPSNNSFAAFTSQDGSTWTQIGGMHTVTMASTSPLVGLAVTSGTTSATITSTLDSVSITNP